MIFITILLLISGAYFLAEGLIGLQRRRIRVSFYPFIRRVFTGRGANIAATIYTAIGIFVIVPILMEAQTVIDFAFMILVSLVGVGVAFVVRNADVE